MLLLLSLLLSLLLLARAVTSDVTKVTWGRFEGPHSLPSLPHFWTSTGLSPLSATGDPPALLSADEGTNLALIGSLPRGALSHVRIHWLLDLVAARVAGEDLELDFSRLDSLMDLLHRYGLFPGLELMGNPSGVFSDLGDERQQRWWRHLVASLAARYIDRYGLDEVQQWRFETWNEPDLKMYNTLNFTLASFEAYFWSSVAGLREAGGGSLGLGGPAGLLRSPRGRHPLCWGLLDAAASHPDALAFISFHRKGNSSARDVVSESRQIVRRLRRSYPELRHLPVVNDEADSLSGWWRAEPWRADVRYAAMTVVSALGLLGAEVRRAEMPLRTLSNDNAFLSTSPNFFTQRTLLARFQMNETDPPHTQFLLKPVYVTLALMSLLGDRELPLSVTSTDPRLAVLAAGTWHRDSTFSAGILVVFSDETFEDPSVRVTINLTLPMSECSAAGPAPRFSVFVLDNERTNPAAEWRRAGSPPFPAPALRRTLRRAQEPYRPVLSEPLPASGEASLSLRLPSVALVQLCTRPENAPGKVSRLHALAVTRGELLLLWSDRHVATRCLLRYEVQFRRSAHQPFLRIDGERDSILLSYHHQVDPSGPDGGTDVNGEYRVRAVDLWGRPGPFSPVLRHRRIE